MPVRTMPAKSIPVTEPDTDFDDVYDPLATPNPAYDDDPAPGRVSSWEGRSLAQVLLARARARQEAIADAFVDSLIGGKISLFRLLLDLEKAAVAGEAEAREARLPTLAELLIPMIERERKQAAEDVAEQVTDHAAAAKAASNQPSSLSALPNPAPEPQAGPAESASGGIADLHAGAESATEAVAGPRACRTRRAKARHGAHPRTCSRVSPAACQRSQSESESKGKTRVPIRDRFHLGVFFLSPDLEMRIGWNQRIWRTLKEKS